MASYNASYPEQVIALLGRTPDLRFGQIHQATGIPSGSLHAILRRLISAGEIHIVQLARGQTHYRLGCTQAHAEAVPREFSVDTSQPGPNGGRLVRFGDLWPYSRALTCTPRGLAGGSSLNNIYA